MGKLINFIKEALKSTVIDEQKTKSFNVKLCETIDRAEKARKSILYSNLPSFIRLQIADEILCLIDDLNELSKIQEMEIDRIWKYNFFANNYPGSL